MDATWKGKPLKDLSKDELIDMLEIINKRWEEDMEEHKRRLSFILQLRKDRKDRG